MHRANFFNRILPVSALLLLVLFKFQNCGPVSPSAQFNGVEDDDGVVAIVDRWEEQQIAFLKSDILVPTDSNQVDLQGLCVGSAKGQIIEYLIWVDSTTPVVIEHGEVECIGGGFEFPVTQVNFASCGEKWYVRAARLGDPSSYAEVQLKPACSSGS